MTVAPTMSTPSHNALQKHRKTIRDLLIGTQLMLCLCILYHQWRSDTYVPISSRQVVAGHFGMGKEGAHAKELQPLPLSWLNGPSKTMSDWLDGIDVQQYPAVLITALYDIGRGQHGRSMDQYKEWFNHTLKIASPLVAFVGDPELVKFINCHRQGLPTYIVLRALKDVYYSHLTPWIASVQQSEQWQRCVGAPQATRLEWVLPHYITINWAKIPLMNEVVGQVSTNSSAREAYFAWVDAGAGRWTAAAEGRTWPSLSKVLQRDPDGDKLIIEEASHRSSTADAKAFLCGPGNGVKGTTMLGTISTWQHLHRNFNNLIFRELLPHDWIGNEQMLLKLLLDRKITRMSLMPPRCPRGGCKSGPKSALSIFDWLS